MDEKELEYYGEYAEMLENSQNLMLEEINRILDDINGATTHKLAEHIRSRIKSSESMKEKLRRRGISEDVKSGLEILSDIIGVRIVTHFVGDVYAILDEIKKSEVWTVDTVKDYISNPKQNGYRSLHVILRLRTTCPDFEYIMTEIQLRTIAMDCWASLEHQMKYKKNIKNADLIVDELKRCADEMASTDLSMQTIREMIESQ